MTLRNIFKNTKHNNKRYPKLITNQAQDVAGIISSYLETKDIACVSRIDRGSYALFSKSLVDKSVKTLLQAVVSGNYNKTEKIIKHNPSLLLQRGTIKDYSGRIHAERTAYQLALGAFDFNVKNTFRYIIVDGMVEMIEKYLKQLPGKTHDEINQIIHDQYMGQFPKGYETIEREKGIQDSQMLRSMIMVINNSQEHEVKATSALDNEIHRIIRKARSPQAIELQNLVGSVIKADSNIDFEMTFINLKNYLIEYLFVTNDKFSFYIFKALYKFRNYFEPKYPQTFGKHFDYALYVEMASYYNETIRSSIHGNSNWDWFRPKSLFCWQKVFGYIQRFVPAQDAQNVAYGLQNIWNGNIKSQRFLSLSYGKRYYPIDENPNLEIGYNCGVHMRTHALKQTGYPFSDWCNALCTGCISKIISNKNKTAAAYAAHIQSISEEIMASKYGVVI